MRDKKISFDDLKSVFPYNSNVELEKMDSNQLELYLQMYTVYRELLSKYLIHLLDLTTYDNEIKNSKLQFKQIEISNMDIYQKFDSDKLNYFYLRNNIYLERLSSEEYNFLYNKMLSGHKFDLDEETIAFIENTFKKVTFEDVNRNGYITNTNYGPEILEYIVPNNSIIIGFRYDVFNIQYENDQDWSIYLKKQQVYFNELVQKIEKKCRDLNLENIRIIKYDDWSIKKLKSFSSRHY